MRGQGSPVSIVCRLRAGRPRNRVSIGGRGAGAFVFPNAAIAAVAHTQPSGVGWVGGRESKQLVRV